MKRVIRHTSSTRQRSEGEVESSSFGLGEMLKSTGVSRFRTLYANDRIVETSLSGTKVRDNRTQVDRTGTAVQDAPSRPPTLADDEVFEENRARSVLSLLIRSEGRDVLERVLSTDDPAVQREQLGRLLLSSHDALYSFSRLVTEGGLTVSERRLTTTPLTDRILQTISENTKP